jgi:hypothetical protein
MGFPQFNGQGKCLKGRGSNLSLTKRLPANLASAGNFVALVVNTIGDSSFYQWLSALFEGPRGTQMASAVQGLCKRYCCPHAAIGNC